MISVIIPTLNSEAVLGPTLTALVPAAVEGIVREVIMVDAGSTDRTLMLADQMGVEVVSGEAARGKQYVSGVRRAKSGWLLFLHADTVLDYGWEHEAAQFIERVESGRRRPAAAAFRFTLDDIGMAPRLVEAIAAFRSHALHRPQGDQGLLISRQLYEEIGGYKPLPMMEDVDLVRRIGRRRMVILRSRALANASRYREDGYLRRLMRKQAAHALYRCRVPAEQLARLYS